MRKKMLKGFTLIELLVVIGIFVIVSTIVVSILVIVLRGTKKSDSIIFVRQNGEYATEQMVRMLRFAKSLDYPSTFGGTFPDCNAVGRSVEYVQVTAIDLSQTILSCPNSSVYAGLGIASNGTSLINVNDVSVIEGSCFFVCTQSSAGTPPTIGISYSLSKVNSNGVQEGNATIPFQTSVTMRNFGSQ